MSLSAKIKAICNWQISEFCQKEYEITKYSLKNNIINNGKYRCKYCAIAETHNGSKSHYFKYSLINHNFFNEVNTEIKAYLLGLIAGDGHIGKKTYFFGS